PIGPGRGAGQGSQGSPAPEGQVAMRDACRRQGHRDRDRHPRPMRRLALRLTAVLALLLAPAIPANAATWTPPALLSDAGAGVGGRPSVALNDAGFGVMTWIENDAGFAVVRAARHAPGGSWVVDPAPLSPASLDACDAFASIDAAGNALVVWAQFGNGCHT